MSHFHENIESVHEFASRLQVASVIKVTPESAMLKWHQERKEDIYASTKREPLGKPMSRGYNIPEEMGATKAFGSFIDASESAHFCLQSTK